MKKTFFAILFALIALLSFSQQTGYKVRYPFWILNANFNLQSGTDTNQVISGEDTLQFFMDEAGNFHFRSKYPVMFERGVQTDTVYMDYFLIDSLKQSTDSMLLTIDASGHPHWVHKDSVGSNFEGYWTLNENVLESTDQADTLKTATWMQVQGRIGINTGSTDHIYYPLTVGSGNSFTPGTIYLFGGCAPGVDTSGLQISGGYPEDDTDSAYFTHWGNGYRFTVNGNDEAFLFGAEKATFKEPVYMPSTVLGGDSIYELRKNGDTIFFNGEQFVCNTVQPWLKNGDEIYYNDGNVGIGTDSPDEKLHIEGQIQFDTTLLGNGGRLIFIPSKNSFVLGRYSSYTSGNYSSCLGWTPTINGDYCYGIGYRIGGLFGNNNGFFGYQAGNSPGTGQGNTLFNVQGSNFNGADYNFIWSTVSSWGSLTTGDHNTGGGFRVAQTETTGSHDFYVGYDVARYSLGADYNIGQMRGSLMNIQSDYHVALGYYTLSLLTANDAQVAISKEALRYGIGANCVAIGEGSGKGSDVTGSDFDNFTGVGDLSGNKLTDGADDNTFLGAGAGALATTAYDCLFAGSGAGAQHTTGSGCVYLGPNAGGQYTTENNKLAIDNSNTIDPLIEGDFSTNDVIINGDLLVTGNSGDITPGIFSDVDTEDRHLAIDVTGLSVIKINTSADNDTITGFTNGKSGQILYIFKSTSANSLIIEHQDAAATDEKIVLKSAADITITGYGGLVLINNGDYWFEIKY